MCFLGFANDENLIRYPEALIWQTCLPCYALTFFWDVFILLSPVSVLLFFRFSGQWIICTGSVLPSRLCISFFGDDEILNRYPLSLLLRKHACCFPSLHLFSTFMLLSPFYVLVFFRFSGLCHICSAAFSPLRLFNLGFGDDEKPNKFPEPLIAQPCFAFYVFTIFWPVVYRVPCFCVAVFSFFWALDNFYSLCFGFKAVCFFFWR